MKENIFKVLSLLGVPRLLRLSKKNTVTVLSLHRISDERDYFYNPIRPQTFYQLIEYCCKYYTITSFENINQQTSKPKLILSFDDGYYDFIEIALPYLKKQGLPSNHNIVNECVNKNVPIWTQRLNNLFNTLKDNHIIDDAVINAQAKFNNNWPRYYMQFFLYLLTVPRKDRDLILHKLLTKYNVNTNCKMMDWEDIRYCIKNGVEIGSHSYHHDSISSILNEIDYETEITMSLREISEKTDTQAQIFALPNGQFNEKVVTFVQGTPIQYLLVVDEKINKLNLSENLNIISRIGLNDNSINETILRTELFHTKIKDKL